MAPADRFKITQTDGQVRAGAVLVRMGGDAWGATRERGAGAQPCSAQDCRALNDYILAFFLYDVCCCLRCGWR